MAFVPAASDFEKIKDRILSYLKLVDDVEADAQAADAIRSALVRLTVYPLKSFLATADITLSATFWTVTASTAELRSRASGPENPLLGEPNARKPGAPRWGHVQAGSLPARKLSPDPSRGSGREPSWVGYCS